MGPSQDQSSTHEGHLHVHGTPKTLTDPWIRVYALAGASIFGGTMTGDHLERNRVRGRSPHGSVFLAGGALVIGDHETALRHTSVDENSVRGRALAGRAEGGGIFDAAVVDRPPGGPLTLLNSRVTRNAALAVSRGVATHGGGIYIRNPNSAKHTVVARNYPDQCDGCGGVLKNSPAPSTPAGVQLVRPSHPWSHLSAGRYRALWSSAMLGR